MPEKSSVAGVWQMMNRLPHSDPPENLTRESPPYSLFMRCSFRGAYPLKPARCFPSSRAEHLLIYRIGSHTNPKRRDFSLKQAGQRSAREDGAGERKGPKRAVECRLKASTHIWENTAGCSSHLTPTGLIEKNRPFGRFFCVLREIGGSCTYFRFRQYKLRQRLPPEQRQLITPVNVSSLRRDRIFHSQRTKQNQKIRYRTTICRG